MNQEELEHVVVTETGFENSFGSTNEIYIMTRCTDKTVVCEGFNIDYQRVTVAPAKEDSPDWSMIITIYIGFSIMLLAFLYFEWRSIINCIDNCSKRLCGGSNDVASIYINEDGLHDDLG